MSNLSRHATLLFAGSFAVEAVILIFVLCLVFVLYWLDRTEKSYLWLGLECSTILLYSLSGLNETILQRKESRRQEPRLPRLQEFDVPKSG